MTTNDNDDPNKKGSDRDRLGRPQPPKPALLSINEEKIIADGKKARIAAGKALAAKARLNPSILDGKTLTRIGDDGRAAFIDALNYDMPKQVDPTAKRSALTEAFAAAGKSPSPNKSQKSAAAKPTPANPTPGKTGAAMAVPRKPVSPLGKKKGWWHHQPLLSPKAATLLGGYVIGACILACFIVVFRTMPY